jgi:hypothetical protein
VSSRETDQRDSHERSRMTDQDLAADRAGRDRLRARADMELEPSHGERSKDTPNTFPRGSR